MKIMENLLWFNQKQSYHSVRVLCDQAGLNVNEKNIICACIYQESEFWNYKPDGTPVKHQNIVKGKVASTDWGIVQCNDFYHIGKGKEFSTVQYVMEHPTEMVKWIISMYKAGCLKQWCSYSSGAYIQWLKTDSPMWNLKT